MDESSGLHCRYQDRSFQTIPTGRGHLARTTCRNAPRIGPRVPLANILTSGFSEKAFKSDAADMIAEGFEVQYDNVFQGCDARSSTKRFGRRRVIFPHGEAARRRVNSAGAT
jgi:hypothetical protein